MPTTDPVHPLDTIGEADHRLMLADALARLTARQRAVLVLRYVEDRTERDTATVLGCSVNTVKSMHRQALARLRVVAPELVELHTEKVTSDD